MSKAVPFSLSSVQFPGGRSREHQLTYYPNVPVAVGIMTWFPPPPSGTVRIALTRVRVMCGIHDRHRAGFLLWDMRDLQGDDGLGCQRSLPEEGKKRV